MTEEHIQMPDIEPVIRYNADGVTLTYSYPFPIFKNEDIVVYFDGARQYSGFEVSGAGQTEGGTITFDIAPANGIIITLMRKLSIGRVTDFMEGGSLSAKALNNELDYLMASLQQIDRENNTMLRYSDYEQPASNILPTKSQRANKALGFDESGEPIAVSLSASSMPADFTATGTGAITRTVPDKLADFISVMDFGAVGDGLTDDSLAFQQALAAHDSIYIPSGTYLITSPITLSENQSIIGAGQTTIIKCQNSNFNAIEIVAGYTSISNLRIENGAAGIKLYGRDSSCVQNSITDISIWQAQIGIELDGYNDSAKPCYWNNFARILIAQPFVNGVHLKLSGAGDTPNANRFHMVRVYSLGAATSGHGFYVEKGSFNNSFTDCESNVNGATAQSCFTCGAGSNKTLLVNIYTESSNGVPNVKLEAGSIETMIMNLFSASDGAAIWDLSGGNYDAINAGYPDKNTLRKTSISDFKATLMRYDTEYIDTAGITDVDLSHTIHLVSATNGAIEMKLPAASTAAGAEITIKKLDNSENLVTITEDNATGPDGKVQSLGGQYDYMTVISNGANWHVKSSNRMAGNTRFFDGTGVYNIDMAVDTYLLSSFGGALEARLPPANAAESIGRTITIKKTDSSTNAITVTEQGGAGPDNYSQPLSSQYEAITIVSNGASWYIISKF